MKDLLGNDSDLAMKLESGRRVDLMQRDDALPVQVGHRKCAPWIGTAVVVASTLRA